MSLANHYTFFYSLITAFTIVLYTKQWAKLIQFRAFAIYYLVPLLWSICFFLIIINDYFITIKWQITDAFQLLTSLSILILFYFIGVLLFQDTASLNKKDRYAYLDYFEHFRQQKTIIFCFALVVFMLQFWRFWHNDKLNILSSFGNFLFYQQNYLLLSSLLLALLIENKWFLFLIGLIVIYLRLNNLNMEI